MSERSIESRGNRYLAPIILAGAVASVPYAAALAEGQSPPEAFVSGTLDWLTAGTENPPSREFKQEFYDHLITLSPELSEDLVEVKDSMVVAHTGAVLSAGLVGGALILRDRRNKNMEQRKRRIAEGREPLRPRGEQMFVLAGEGNNIIDELAKCGQPFVPIFESDSGSKSLITRYGSEKPFYLNIDVDGERTGLSYLSTNAWDNLNLTSENMINSDNGQRYLMVVGLGMRRDKELSQHPENIDVSQVNLRSAAQRIFESLPKGTLKPSLDPVTGKMNDGRRDIVDVYVGSSELRHEDPLTGYEINDRELAQTTGVDVYIDSTTVALKAISDELNRLGVSSINLATSSSHYLVRFGTQIPEFTQAQGRRVEVDTRIDADTGNYLVYEGDSESTFMAASRLRKHNPTARILALVTSDLSEQAKKARLTGIEDQPDVIFINTSEILARILGDVRNCLKLGILPNEIQDLIDASQLPFPVESDDDK